MNNDDLDTDKDLSYSDKQIVRHAREDSARLKEIQANQTDEEKREIQRQVNAASSNMTIKREEKLARQDEESDIDFRERTEFELKQRGY